MQIWMDPWGKIHTGPQRKFPFRELVLERGNAFPWFPQYRVAIHADGNVEWDGQRQVVELGLRKWRLSPEQVEGLQALLEQIQLSQFDHTTQRFGDAAPLPTIRVVFEDGTELVKNTLDSWGKPDGTEHLVKQFNALADAIDEMAGTAPLVRPPHPVDRRALSFLNLTLERGACFGPCPVYAVNVARDGKVDWIGEMWTEAAGERSWIVSTDVVEKLRQSLLRAKFTELEDRYDGCVTDQSSATITVQFLNGRSKRVWHYHGYWETSPEAQDIRKRLLWLENRIDRLLGTKQYIGTKWD